MRHIHASFWHRFFPLALGILAGCKGSEPVSNLIPVGGSITIDGNALRSGTVLFVPEDPALETARGTINRKSFYTMSSGDKVGVLPGRYTVVVETPDGAQCKTKVEVVDKELRQRYDLELQR